VTIGFMPLAEPHAPVQLKETNGQLSGSVEALPSSVTNTPVALVPFIV